MMRENSRISAISIIIPVLNEAAIIASALDLLQIYRARGCELIVVDSGSIDGTPELARPLADRVIRAPRGRARQMNAGAAVACNDILLFLHADTLLPDWADSLIDAGLAHSSSAWGRFDVHIEGRHALLGLVAGMMNARSRLTGIATGDQAMFITRAAFDAVGGFPQLELMEDIAISSSLKRISPPLCLPNRVTTSGRRWEKRGVLRTIALMWWLRLCYFFGASPARLVQTYNGSKPV